MEEQASLLCDYPQALGFFTEKKDVFGKDVSETVPGHSLVRAP